MDFKLPILASLCLVIAVLFVSSPVTLSELDGGPNLLIQQIASKDGANAGDVCAQFAAPSSCPVNCFRADPVCGVDGVTYWCGCGDAKCRGVSVAKLGACEVGNGGASSSLPGQALLLVHIVWLIMLGFSLLFGLF